MPFWPPWNSFSQKLDIIRDVCRLFQDHPPQADVIMKHEAALRELNTFRNLLGSGPIKSRDSFWASIVIPSSDGGICDERFVLADASATCATGTAFSIVARQASGGRFASDLGDHFRDQEWLALA